MSILKGAYGAIAEWIEVADDHGCCYCYREYGRCPSCIYGTVLGIWQTREWVENPTSRIWRNPGSRVSRSGLLENVCYTCGDTTGKPHCCVCDGSGCVACIEVPEPAKERIARYPLKRDARGIMRVVGVGGAFSDVMATQAASCLDPDGRHFAYFEYADGYKSALYIYLTGTNSPAVWATHAVYVMPEKEN